MKRIALALSLALAAAALASAHPHMSLSSKLEFEFEGKKCRGFWVDWTFDPYFSASILREQDRNGDGKLDAAEIRGIHDNAFINLRKYGFFTYVRSGSVRRSPETVEKFTAEIRGGRLAYRFFVPVGSGGDVNVAIMDTTYFCAVQYLENPATAVQLTPGGPTPDLRRAVDKQHPVYYDPSQSSTDNSKHDKWRPGLETAYPEEIRAVF